MSAYIAGLEAYLSTLHAMLSEADRLGLSRVSLNFRIGRAEEELRFARVVASRCGWIEDAS
jgi:hypothetical protein